MITDGLITSETEFLLKNSRMVTVVETYLCWKTGCPLFHVHLAFDMSAETSITPAE